MPNCYMIRIGKKTLAKTSKKYVEGWIFQEKYFNTFLFRIHKIHQNAKWDFIEIQDGRRRKQQIDKCCSIVAQSYLIPHFMSMLD